MADEADLASEREELFRSDALRAASRPTHHGNGVCKWCGDDIEENRLAAVPFAAHCADCAFEIEEDRLKSRRRGF